MRIWVGLVVIAACWQSSSAPRRQAAPPPGKLGAVHAAVDRSEFLATWADDRNNTASIGNYLAYAARVRADGTLVDPQGIAVDARARRGPPTVLSDVTPRGWWVVSDFADFNVPSAKRWLVSATRVDANGTVGTPIQASDLLTDSVDYDLAAAGDDVLVTWAGVRRTKTEAAVIVGDHKTPVALPANAGRRPGAAFDPVSDSYVLCYREPAVATCAVIDRGGGVGTTVAIPTPAPKIDDGLRVAPLQNGEVMLTWVEADEKTVTAARLDVASAQITSRATLLVAQGNVRRHAIVRGRRGFVFAWLEQGSGVPVFNAVLLAGNDPFTAQVRALALPVSRPDAMPQIQAGSRGFLVTWSVGNEPFAVRVDDDGAALDTAPISLRGVRDEPVPAAQLRASLDVVAGNGADYCPHTGNSRDVPPTVRGLYVVEGQQPWGMLYIPGFSWGGSTGSVPRRSFYVGRDAEFVPHWKAQAGSTSTFELSVEIPDLRRKRTERITIENDDAAAAAAGGVAGPIDLVDFETNGGLGGRGFHFVVTKATVIEDAKVLAKRFTAARAEFDKLVKTSKIELDRTLADAKQKMLSATKNPTQGAVPRKELVIYLPTYRSSTGQIEILFGYLRTEGVMMKFPPDKPGSRHGRGRDQNLFEHPVDDSPRPNPRPVTWSVVMGARFTLAGDKIIKQEIWAPYVPGSDGRIVPWQCTAPKGPPVGSLCAGAPPAPDCPSGSR